MGNVRVHIEILHVPLAFFFSRREVIMEVTLKNILHCVLNDNVNSN